MIRIKNILGILITAPLLLISTSCEKFLDVNQNLNDPTSVPVSTLLTSSERAIGGGFCLGTTIGNTLAMYTHQLTGRIAGDRYGLTGNGIGWNPIYQAAANLDVIIEQGTAESRLAYVGIAKILKAYTFSLMVDIWGDVPYSEFNQFKGGVLQPKFDKGADIYPQLISLLNEGIADIDNPVTNPSKPAADDVIYAGNLTRWKKAANTIKLKLLTQQRLVKDVKAEVSALLASPAGLIDNQNESFLVPFGPNGATDDRHPAYGDYTATQRGGALVSPWFYEVMKGWNKGILTGIEDPRIPYYFYNQKLANGVPENATEYRDGGFISIVFGSAGPFRDGSNSNTYTLMGIYPAGGRYDAGQGGSISGTGATSPANAGTGATPTRFITYADRLFLEAELINAGVITGDQKAVFSKALDASFAQVDQVVGTYVKPVNQTVPVLATTEAATAYKTAVLAAFDAGSNTKKLEHIMTQKWISRYGNPVDNYTDYRRTGYPVMFDPNNPEHAPGGFVQPPLNGNFQVVPQAAVPVVNQTPYPASLPWPQAELNINGSAPSQKVPSNAKVFWQP